jgi:hypothetical protein
MPNLAAGAGSAALGEAARGTDYEGAARLAGAVAGAGGAGVVRSLRDVRNPEHVIAKAAGASGQTSPGITLEELQRLRAAGHDVSLLDVRNVRRLAEGAMGRQSDSPAAYRIQESLEQRARNAPQAYSSGIETAMGRPVDAHAALQAAKAESQLATEYPRIYGLPHAQDVNSPDLTRLANDRAGRQATEKASELLSRNLGTTVENPFVEINGVMQLRPGAQTNLQFWDYFKRALDDEAERLTRSGATTEAHSISSMTNDLKRVIGGTDAAPGIVPEYASLLAAGRRYYGQENAFDAGSQFFKDINPAAKYRDPTKIAELLHHFDNTYSPVEQQAFRTSLANSLKENPDLAVSMFSKNNSTFEGRLRHILGDVEFNGIKNTVNAHNVASSLRSIRERSSKDVSPYASGTVAGLASSVLPILQGAAIGPTGIGIASALATRGIHILKDRMAASIVQTLERNDPAAIERMIKFINSNPEASRTLERISQAMRSVYATQTEQPERPGHARGGKIRAPNAGKHKAKAMSLIRAAEQAKKAHNSTTEPTLDMPDEMVAKALSIADKAI